MRRQRHSVMRVESDLSASRHNSSPASAPIQGQDSAVLKARFRGPRRCCVQLHPQRTGPRSAYPARQRPSCRDQGTHRDRADVELLSCVSQSRWYSMSGAHSAATLSVQPEAIHGIPEPIYTSPLPNHHTSHHDEDGMPVSRVKPGFRQGRRGDTPTSDIGAWRSCLAGWYSSIAGETRLSTGPPS